MINFDINMPFKVYPVRAAMSELEKQISRGA